MFPATAEDVMFILVIFFILDVALLTMNSVTNVRSILDVDNCKYWIRKDMQLTSMPLEFWDGMDITDIPQRCPRRRVRDEGHPVRMRQTARHSIVNTQSGDAISRKCRRSFADAFPNATGV